MSARVRPCRNCSAVLSIGYQGDRCPFCLMPMAELVLRPKRKSKRVRARERSARQFNEPELYHDNAAAYRRKDRAATRRAEDRDAKQHTLHDSFEDTHAGHPLGRGMPMGEPLREDGETHREAWMRVLRLDCCSYCGGGAGTVDHIIPQSSGARGLHTWLNYTGACQSCNGSKGSKPLLLWLVSRRGTMPRVHSPELALQDGR